MRVYTEEQKARKKAWHKANAEKMKALKAAYRKANPEKVKAWKAAYQKVNPEKVKAQKAAWYKTNPEKAKARNRRSRQHAHLCNLQTTIAAIQKVAATAQKQISAQIKNENR